MKKERVYSLDFLRILATVIIVFHHYPSYTKTVLGVDFSDQFFYWGYLVEFFFLLAGYVMWSYAVKIENGMSFTSFLSRRLVRLLPVAAFSTLFFEAVMFLYKRTFGETWYSYDISLWKMIITCLGIQDGGILLDRSVNEHLWYLSVLLTCYVVFFFVTWLFSKKKLPKIYAYVIMVLVGLSIQTYGLNLPMLNGEVARGYKAFFFGLVLAYITENRWKGMKSCLCSFGIVTVLNIIFVRYYWFVRDGIDNNLLFIYYPALIILFRSTPIQKLLNFRVLGTLGELTYGVYVWHYSMIPVMLILAERFHWDVDLTSEMSMLVFTVLTFVVAGISYYLIEKPAQKYLEKKMRGRIL